MDLIKGKERKGNLIIKTWERCKSFGRSSQKKSGIVRSITTKSKSLPSLPYNQEQETNFKNSSSSFSTTAAAAPRKSRKIKVAPDGCFSVYVGPQKQRFVVKTEYANHPLFKTLLEEAESEYGYSPEGPLALPCNVDIFVKVLLAMDSDDYDQEFLGNPRIHGCGFSKNFSSYRLLSPSRMVAINQL